MAHSTHSLVFWCFYNLWWKIRRITHVSPSPLISKAKTDQKLSFQQPTNGNHEINSIYRRQDHSFPNCVRSIHAVALGTNVVICILFPEGENKPVFLFFPWHWHKVTGIHSRPALTPHIVERRWTIIREGCLVAEFAATIYEPWRTITVLVLKAWHVPIW